MNAVEIDEAVSKLADAPFDAKEFPFAFSGGVREQGDHDQEAGERASNKSDLGGVLQTNNIHIAVSPPGEVTKTLMALKARPATARAKARFVLATDGQSLEAEDLGSGETVACAYADLAEHFGFFLALAGITTVRQIRESAFDIRATSRLNKLYVALLEPGVGSAERGHDMNHFMARLIFCFFAEDTDIFHAPDLFTATVDQMSARDSSNTDRVIGEIFQSMNTRFEERKAAGIRSWADVFPYVNGGLFSGSLDVPRFSKIARSYLLHIGSLDWTKINPDIFGSMIQAVADDEERGALGMHYTSVPNILKVLNPLFLDDLRARLDEAGDNARMLLNLRRRMARIRVFDPACGSGNFLVIAYKAMRKIEAEINARRKEHDRASEMPLTNFRGIEIWAFPAEIARLSLIIAEFQCDVLYRGPKLALAEFLPLDSENWITWGNALQLDWCDVCPPTGTGVTRHADDLFRTPLEQTLIDFENDGGETYVCGNPPYLGSKWQSEAHKDDLEVLFDGRTKNWKSLDYVAGWFLKASDYGRKANSAAVAFVATNSICQGQQVSILWPLLLRSGHEISFAHTSFKWSNFASQKAGVIVVIVGLSRNPGRLRRLYSVGEDGGTEARDVPNINAYLVPGPNVFVSPSPEPRGGLGRMLFGNHPYYGAGLIFSAEEGRRMREEWPAVGRLIRPLYGSKEFISSTPRACLWIQDEDLEIAARVPWIATRLKQVEDYRRQATQDEVAQLLAETPHRFRDRSSGLSHTIVVPRVSSEAREYLPVGLLGAEAIVQDQAFAMYDVPLWNIAIVASRLHRVWISTVCGKLKNDFRYSSTLGWNTFPVPLFTDKNRADLTRCAEDILLAREAHFPSAISDLYGPDPMPSDLREAHDRNDETLERIYIGRQFKNDTERLEKLFALYAKMAPGGDKAHRRKREAIA